METTNTKDKTMTTTNTTTTTMERVAKLQGFIKDETLNIIACNSVGAHQLRKAATIRRNHWRGELARLEG